MNKFGGYPNDLNNSEHGSPVTVMTLNGKFKRIEKATYWPDVSRNKLGRKSGKAR